MRCAPVCLGILASSMICAGLPTIMNSCQLLLMAQSGIKNKLEWICASDLSLLFESWLCLRIFLNAINYTPRPLSLPDCRNVTSELPSRPERGVGGERGRNIVTVIMLQKSG